MSIGKKLLEINELKEQLYNKFETEDLGAAAYFLGVRIQRDRKLSTISLCQDIYIRKILERFNMQDCHPVNTPIKGSLEEYMVPNTDQADHVYI
jgi:hypothetical protein